MSISYLKSMLPPLIPSLLARPTPQQPPPSPLGAVTRAGISGAGAMMRSGADLFLAPAQRVAATHAALTPLLIRHGTTHIQQRVSPITDHATRVAPAVQREAATHAALASLPLLFGSSYIHHRVATPIADRAADVSDHVTRAAPAIQRAAVPPLTVSDLALRHGSSHIQQRVSPIIDHATRAAPAIQRAAVPPLAVSDLALRHGSSHIHQRVNPLLDQIGAAASASASRIERGAVLATSPAGRRLSTTLLGYGGGTAVDVATAPTRATIAPDMPLAREQFARHPEQMAEGALIGASLISAAIVPGLLFFGGGGAASVAGPAAASAIARTGGAAGIGHATGGATVASAAVDTIIKAATVGTVAGAAAHHSAHINIPTGNPDWVDRWRDPHGGIGSRGGEIPLPDWMRGDPEVPLSPGVDWRAPEEDLSDYLDYLDKTRSGHPPGRGPMPYYQGPEIQQPGTGTRQIDSPELTPAPDYHGAPEILIGRTIHTPEIEPRPDIFPGELTTPTGPDPFPAELPDPRRHQAPDILRDLYDFARPPLHPLGDPVSPIWRTPDYLERVASALPVSAGAIVGGGGGIPRIIDDLDIVGNDITRSHGLGGFIAGTPAITDPKTKIQPDIDISTWTKKLIITEGGTGAGTTTVPFPVTVPRPSTIFGFAMGTDIQPDINISAWTRAPAVTRGGANIGTGIWSDVDMSAWTRAPAVTRGGTSTGTGILTIPDTQINIPAFGHPDLTISFPADYPPRNPIEFPPGYPRVFRPFSPDTPEDPSRRRDSSPSEKEKRKSSPDPAGWGFWETLRVATPAEFLGIGSGRTTRRKENSKRG